MKTNRSKIVRKELYCKTLGLTRSPIPYGEGLLLRKSEERDGDGASNNRETQRHQQHLGRDNQMPRCSILSRAARFLEKRRSDPSRQLLLLLRPWIIIRFDFSLLANQPKPPDKQRESPRHGRFVVDTHHSCFCAVEITPTNMLRASPSFSGELIPFQRPSDQKCPHYLGSNKN
jgi:hypothetical protein